MALKRPRFNPRADYVALKDIRLGADLLIARGTVVKVGEMHPRRLRRWSRLRWMGPVGHPWTEQRTASLEMRREMQGFEPEEAAADEAPAEKEEKPKRRRRNGNGKASKPTEDEGAEV